MREEFAALNAMIDDALTAGLPKSMGLPDWTYRDLPRLSPEFMAEFKRIAGDDNLKWITFADYGKTQRGQVLISPEGMARIRAAAAEQAA